MALLIPPEGGATVRMYRQGHGDCFLIAVARPDGAAPFYLVIDCGMKAGSELPDGPALHEVVADIAAATGGRIDALAITHEHEDHVTGFLAADPGGRRAWDAVAVAECWLAWTEDGDDAFANALREEFGDTLAALMGAGQRLAAVGGERAGLVDALLELEAGGPEALAELRAAGDFALSKAKIKGAVRAMRDQSGPNVRFFRPDRGPLVPEGVPGLRVFALGPPRDVALLRSLDPRAGEEFHLAADAEARGFLGALTGHKGGADPGRPFAARHGIRLAEGPEPGLADADAATRTFFERSYGAADAAWRRIDGDWLDSAEALALRINNEVNNTSLVLALELVPGGRVLLFPGDAQRGSWASWGDLAWTLADGSRVTARDLLARTVLYKVGHHGSHNATLNGDAASPHANLAWMATGALAGEFVAMIPAHEAWARALRPHPWRHPLEAIAAALREKAAGRVLQTDAGLTEPPRGTRPEVWARFAERVRVSPLFIDCDIPGGGG